MPSHRRTAPRRTHGVMARLTRLAASALAVSVVLAACTALAHSAEPHRCVHDSLQRAAAAAGILAPVNAAVSPVGLPYVEVSMEEAAGGMVENAAELLAGSSAPAVTRTEAWGAFRIELSTDDLTTAGSYCASVGQTVNDHQGVNVTCAEEDVLTAGKYNVLMKYLLPQAVQMHTDRLQVKRVRTSWRVTGMDRAVCTNFVVPPSHMSYGLRRTDFILYVASVPADAGVRAWAITCQVFANDQPAVGVLNVPARYIADEYDQQEIHAITHEIAHALGFSSTFFTNVGFYDSVTGIRGKTYAAPVLNGTMVVNKTQEQYGCDSASYMELEDMGVAGTVSSHWKARNAASELMSTDSVAGLYSALTIAAFEDLGYYKGIYSRAENMTWGYKAGCPFLTSLCVANGVSQFPSMFCDATETVFRCTADRMALGTCTVDTFAADLPTYFQYFATATMGGPSAKYDYCPTVAEWNVGSCTQSAEDAVDNVTVFNVFATSSRCMDGSFTPQAMAGASATAYAGMCVNVMCDASTRSYSVRVHGSRGYHACPAGSNLNLSTISGSFEDGGYVTCPAFEEVCQSNLLAALDFQRAANAAASPRAAAAAALLALVVVMLGAQ